MPGLRDEHFNEINRLRARLRRLLDETFPQPSPSPARSAWTPRADIHASPHGVVVALEVCGVPRDAMDVSVKGRVLTVSGSRNSEGDRTGEAYFHAERPSGDFSRSFSLSFEPRSVDARLEKGVLTVTLTQ